MFWLTGISRPRIHFQHTVISFKSREESRKSFYWLINLFVLRWLNNPEWTAILQRLHRVIITLRCRLCCHSDRKSMWRKQMCAAAYVIKVHQYRIAPFLHVGLFTQQTWQQTGVTPGLQIISDSSRVTAQKVTPPGTQPSLWRIAHPDPSQTRLCCHDVETKRAEFLL